jgi:hypothetical protein
VTCNDSRGSLNTLVTNYELAVSGRLSSNHARATAMAGGVRLHLGRVGQTFPYGLIGLSAERVEFSGSAFSRQGAKALIACGKKLKQAAV